MPTLFTPMAESPENWMNRKTWVLTFTFSGPVLFAIGALYRRYRDGTFTASNWLLFFLWACPLCVLLVHRVARHLSQFFFTDETPLEMTESQISTLFWRAQLILLMATIIAVLSLIRPVPAPLHISAITFGSLTSLFVTIASIWHYFVRHDRISLARATIALLPLALFVAIFVARITERAG